MYVLSVGLYNPTLVIFTSSEARKNFAETARRSIVEPVVIERRALRRRDGMRVCVGDYRIIYTVQDDVLVVVVVDLGHRREVYR